MSAFLTALTSVANQYGDAGNSAREEKQARADKLRTLDVNDAYLQIAKQAEERQQQESKERIAKGDLIKIGNRLWSVSQGKFVDMQQVNPLDSLKQFISTLPKEVQPGAAARAKATMEADPNDPHAAINEVMKYADAQQAETNRRQDAATRHQEHEEDVQQSEKFRRQQSEESRAFQREMAAERRDFTKSLFDARREGLTPAAEKVLYTVEPVVSQLDRMREDIHNLGLDNNNQNGYLLPSRLGYAFGKASPEGSLAKDIAGLSLGSVIEAASAIQGTSRSLQALKLAAVHTPNAWKDSPMLIRQKLEEIRRRLVDIMADAKKYGTKSGLPNAGAEGAVDIDKVLDEAFGTAGGKQK